MVCVILVGHTAEDLRVAAVDRSPDLLRAVEAALATDAGGRDPGPELRVIRPESRRGVRA